MDLYGLIGYPLGHSFSKQYFTEKFLKEGLQNCVYETFPIPTIELFPDLLRDNPALKGLNVTIPYKEQVLRFVDQQSEEVLAIGAANCIKIDGKGLCAYNTDIVGFERSFTPLLKPFHKKALILGSGGSSKAIQYVLRKRNIEFLIVSRNAEAAPDRINQQSINQQILNEFTIIINATPVGMWPNDNACPEIPYYLLSSQHYLFDLVYKPEKTLFLKKGEEMGATIQNGYAMLLIQAEESWRIWNTEM